MYRTDASKPILPISNLQTQALIRAWPIALVLFLTTALYFPVRHFEFLAIDDGMHTENNPHVHPFTFENFASFWIEPYENAYTPITYNVWMLLASFAHQSPEKKTASATFLIPQGFKFNAGVFHLGNLLVHLATCYALFLLLQQLFGSPKAASIGAALFAIHPLQVESVCWITGLRDVLAGWFSILSLYYYTKYFEAEPPKQFKSQIFINPWKRPPFTLSFVFFLLACLSKSSSLVVPCFMGVLVITFWKRNQLISSLELLPWYLFVLPLVQVFTSLNGSVAERVVFQAPLEGRIIVALDAIAFYLYKIFFPLTLAMDYGRTPQYVLKYSPFLLTAGATVIVFMILTFFLIKFRQGWTYTAFLLFVAGLLPVLGITPFIFQHISTVADRYVYLSMLGPAFGLAYIYQHCSSSPFSNRHFKMLKASVFGALFLFGVKSYFQIPYWKSNRNLFSHTLTVTPHSWLAANDLGTVYESLKDYSRASALYKKAAEISGIPRSWNNYGATSLKNGNIEGAIDGFTQALITGNYPYWAYNNLGTAFAHQGDRTAARENYEKALEINPDFPFALKNLTALKRGAAAHELTVQRSSKD